MRLFALVVSLGGGGAGMAQKPLHVFEGGLDFVEEVGGERCPHAMGRVPPRRAKENASLLQLAAQYLPQSFAGNGTVISGPKAGFFELPPIISVGFYKYMNDNILHKIKLALSL